MRNIYNSHDVVTHAGISVVSDTLDRMVDLLEEIEEHLDKNNSLLEDIASKIDDNNEYLIENNELLKEIENKLGGSENSNI